MMPSNSNCAFVFDYPPIDFTMWRNEQRCSVPAINGWDDFSVCQTSHTDPAAAAAFADRIQDGIAPLPKLNNVTTMRPMLACVVFDENDQRFARGMITEVDPVAATANVSLVDIGNDIEHMPFDQIHPLPVVVAEPPRALLCKAQNLDEMNKFGNPMDVAADAFAFFVRLVDIAGGDGVFSPVLVHVRLLREQQGQGDHDVTVDQTLPMGASATQFNREGDATVNNNTIVPADEDTSVAACASAIRPFGPSRAPMPSAERPVSNALASAAAVNSKTVGGKGKNLSDMLFEEYAMIEKVYDTCATARTRSDKDVMIVPYRCTLNYGIMPNEKLLSLFERKDEVQITAGVSFEGGPSANMTVSENHALVVLTKNPHRCAHGEATVGHAVIKSVLSDGTYVLYSRTFGVEIAADASRFQFQCESSDLVSTELWRHLTVVARFVAVRPPRPNRPLYTALKVVVLPVHGGVERLSGVLYSVHAEFTTIMYDCDEANETTPFRYVQTLNDIVNNNGIPVDDWFGRRVLFAACIDQPGEHRDDDDDGVSGNSCYRYKAVYVEIEANKPRTTLFLHEGVFNARPIIDATGVRGAASSGKRPARANSPASVPEDVLNEWKSIEHEKPKSQPAKSEVPPQTHVSTTDSEDVNDELRRALAESLRISNATNDVNRSAQSNAPTSSEMIENNAQAATTPTNASLNHSAMSNVSAQSHRRPNRLAARLNPPTTDSNVPPPAAPMQQPPPSGSDWAPEPIDDEEEETLKRAIEESLKETTLPEEERRRLEDEDIKLALAASMQQTENTLPNSQQQTTSSNRAAVSSNETAAVFPRAVPPKTDVVPPAAPLDLLDNLQPPGAVQAPLQPVPVGTDRPLIDLDEPTPRAPPISLDDPFSSILELSQQSNTTPTTPANVSSPCLDELIAQFAPPTSTKTNEHKNQATKQNGSIEMNQPQVNASNTVQNGPATMAGGSGAAEASCSAERSASKSNESGIPSYITVRPSQFGIDNMTQTDLVDMVNEFEGVVRSRKAEAFLTNLSAMRDRIDPKRTRFIRALLHQIEDAHYGFI